MDPSRRRSSQRGSATRPRQPASVAFTVPAKIKFLDAEQLAALTESFRAWYLESARPRDRRARGRVWLTYLLIRFTGAKLGEVVAIDDRRDLDVQRGSMKLGAGKKDLSERSVQLPPDVVEALIAHLEDPANRSSRGQVFRLDQGFVRRKFYERADACLIPRDLVNPQVLRASRAVELLRGGMPLPVVQRILGQRTADLTASYVDYEPADVSQIFEAYLLGELRSRTSARNLFAGRVAEIARGEILSEIMLKTSFGHRIVSVITNTSLENLGLRKGSPATALIKAPSVAIAKDENPPRISARNILSGRVKSIRSDGVLTEATVMLSGDTQVCALITAHSAKSLALAEEDDVWVSFDTSAVILSVPGRG
jgi:molybdate transport system regulatory protein